MIVLLEERKGSESCEHAQVLGGTIKTCDYKGFCDSQQTFGYTHLCKYGLIKDWGKPAEENVNCAATNLRSLIRKLAE